MYALVICDKPSTVSSEEKSRWELFVSTADKTITLNKDTQRLSEGVYLYNLENGLQAFLILFDALKNLDIVSRTLLMDEKPQWIYDKS